MSTQFDHEKLKVYQQALQFVAVATSLLEVIPKTISAHNQLDRASTAIALNIAEGTGKWTAPDRCRFYDIARGSALECAACLDVLVVKQLLSAQAIADPKQLLVGVVSMLVGLTKAIAPNRVYEDAAGFGEV
ncbi:MAG: four helix bundle protein [Chthoniobacterales bacterium]|nr:four helix bundle protein [Chthoniobacterales bacterium]